MARGRALPFSIPALDFSEGTQLCCPRVGLYGFRKFFASDLSTEVLPVGFQSVVASIDLRHNSRNQYPLARIDSCGCIHQLAIQADANRHRFGTKALQPGEIRQVAGPLFRSSIHAIKDAGGLFLFDRLNPCLW